MSEKTKQHLREALEHAERSRRCLLHAMADEPDYGYRKDITDVWNDIHEVHQGIKVLAQ